MNYLLKTTVLSAFLFTSSLTLNAQTNQTSQINEKTPEALNGIRIGAGFDLLSPIGKKTRTLYDGGYGISVQADMPLLNKKLYLIANGGFETLYAKEDVGGNPIIGDAKRVPLKFGLKYFAIGNLYFQNEAGFSLLTNKSDFVGGKAASFTFASRTGYLLNLGGHNSLDLSARYEQTSSHYSSGKSTTYLGFRASYVYRF